MTGFLFDTNIVLLGLSEPVRIPQHVRDTVEGQVIYVSVISYWEVLLKSMKGALDVGDPRRWWADALDQLAARPLPLRPEHAAHLYDLPPIHKDPFDRMLIAQAMAENLELVSTDREIPKYAGQRLRVLS
jgi:PIN domain nuclease of toxin-antitoxin system